MHYRLDFLTERPMIQGLEGEKKHVAITYKNLELTGSFVFAESSCIKNNSTMGCSEFKF